jgi:hypothetical protein
MWAHDLFHAAYPGKVHKRISLEPFALPIELQGLQGNIEADLVAVFEAVG